MTVTDMEVAIGYIRNRVDILSERMIYTALEQNNFTDTEIRYCYVLATGKNMEV